MNGNGLPIDDTLVKLGYSGELDEDQGTEDLSRTALLEMFRRHGFDGAGGFRDLAAALDRWGVQSGRNSRVLKSDLRAVIDEGRIVPTVRVYQSEWNRMMETKDLMARLRIIDDMLERLAVPTRYYNERTSRLQAIRDEVNQEISTSMDIGITRPLIPDAV